LYVNATPKWARLPKGMDGQYFKLVSGLPAWADAPAGGGGTPESILMGCMVIALSGFDVYGTAGTVIKESWGAKVSSPGTMPYTGYAFYRYMDVDAPSLFDKNPQFELYLRFSSATTDVLVIVGGTAGAWGTTAHKKFGIFINAGALKIISSDGTTQTTSASLMALSADTWYRIRCKLTSAGQIEVWVDGVSKGTKSTNLPSGVLTAAHGCPQILAVGDDLPTQQTARFASLKVMHDY